VFDFEATLKLIVIFGVGAFTLIATGVGIKFLFFRRPALPAAEDDERVAQLEAKVADLEERVDFSERMLAEVRGRLQLPGKP
jgi:hypothetical protein